jgi:hypothetical protein
MTDTGGEKVVRFQTAVLWGLGVATITGLLGFLGNRTILDLDGRIHALYLVDESTTALVGQHTIAITELKTMAKENERRFNEMNSKLDRLLERPGVPR